MLEKQPEQQEKEVSFMEHSMVQRMGRVRKSSTPKKREVRNPYDGLRFWSAWTHGAGAVLAVLGTVLLVVRAALQENWEQVVVFSIYGGSMICLYTASTLYHSVNTTEKKRIALRKYDHCSIYLLIAGSYTPVCICVLKGHGGIALISVIWSLVIAGMILTIAKLDLPRWLTSVIYLVMGWLALTAIVPLSRLMSGEGMMWLLLGGICYSVGGVLYAVKWPGRHNPKFGCHEIFHVWIVLGSVMHYLMMYRVVAAM